MQVLKDGDKIVCTRGCEPFTVGEVYKVSSVVVRSFSILAKGREYFGVIDEEGIKVSTTNFLIYFEFYVPNEEFFQDSEGKIPTTKNGDPVGLIKADNLSWTHEGNALVSVMLLGGVKYVMCEIGEESKQYCTDGVIPRFIVEKDEDGCFIDVDGNMWQSAQAINNDGSIMSYEQYLKTNK